MGYNKNIHYNYNDIKSYNKAMNFILSSRGLGKSYGLKKEVIGKFLRYGKQFVYLRRTGKQLDEVKGKFWTDIQDAYPNHKLELRGNTFYCDNKVMGWMISITKPGKLRGASYHNVTTIWFDEFISIGSEDDRYRKNECRNFMNICDTIIRMRSDVKIYLLGNSHTASNPYFDYFNIDVKVGERFNVYKNMIIDDYVGDAFAQEREKTPFGQIMRATEYGTFSLDNQSIVDSDAFIKERSKSSEFLFNLEYEHKGITVMYDRYTGLYYCRSLINKEYKGTVVFEEHKINDDTKYCKRWRDVREMEMMKLAFEQKLVYYDNQSIKNKMFSVYKKVGII